MKKVAVTGGLSSGKSTVCQMFGEYGAAILSADEIIHELYLPDSQIGKKVIALLGKEVIVNGAFDRKRIAQKVFNDKSLLLQLEQLLHPEVQKVIETKYQQICKQKNQPPFFVVEIPLLFESSLDHFYDATIAVVADEKTCMERFVKRGGTQEEFVKRNTRLLPWQEKAKRATFVVRNDGSQEELKQAIEKIITKL